MASVAGLRERYLAELKSFRVETKEGGFPKLQEEKKSFFAFSEAELILQHRLEMVSEQLRIYGFNSRADSTLSC